MPTVILEPLDYAEAADNFRAVSTNALNNFSAASSALRKFGNMAGDDNGGQAFADAYDGGAQVMLQGLYDIAIAASSFDRGLMSTGKMHHQADQFAAGLPANDGAFVIRNVVPGMSVAGPPTAYGGPANPGPIDVIRDIIALVWPNADTPLMKEAAGVWTGISEDFYALARQVRQADSPLGSVVSAEVGYINTKVDELANGIDELGDSAHSISEVCSGYAQDVDDAHNEMIPMAVQLVAEIAIGVGISAALSFVTFGAAAVVGTGVLAARIAFVGARITAIIVRVGGTALRVATRLRQIVTSLQRVAERFKRLFQVGVEILSSTTSSVVAEGAFNGQNANFGAAAFGGLIGGGVAGGITATLAARTASLMGRIAVGTFAGTASGGLGAAADSIVRIGEFDAKAIFLGATVGGVGGGVFHPHSEVKPGSGNASPTAATADVGGAPKIDSPNLPQDLSLDGTIKTPDVDVPTHPGGDSTPGGGSTLPRVDVDPFTPQVDVDPVTTHAPAGADPMTPRAPVDADPFTPQVDVDPVTTHAPGGADPMTPRAPVDADPFTPQVDVDPRPPVGADSTHPDGTAPPADGTRPDGTGPDGHADGDGTSDTHDGGLDGDSADGDVQGTGHHDPSPTDVDGTSSPDGPSDSPDFETSPSPDPFDLGPRKIPDDLYDSLRRLTPDEGAQVAVNAGHVIGSPDVALPGKTVDGPLQADHIVAMDKIARLENFDRLTPTEMVNVLNHPDNFMGLSPSANASKGSKSYVEWTTYVKENLPVDPAFREMMMKRELELLSELQALINGLTGG
jgi:hypothetical protein